MRQNRPGQMLCAPLTFAGSPFTILGTATATVAGDGLFPGGKISQWGLRIRGIQTDAGVYVVSLRAPATATVFTDTITFDETTGALGAIFFGGGNGIDTPEGTRISVEVVVTGSPSVAPSAYIWAKVGA